MRMIIISVIFLRMITNYFFIGDIQSNYFFDLLVHHLSKMKYQIEFAIGSTMASVRATLKETSATNIKTVIAIIKCPIV
mgnify:CR=1 FL=1